VLAASADGYFPAEKKTMAVQGQSQLIELELKPRPARVKVATEDGAQIEVDGRPGSALLELGPGKHWITVTRRGREPFAREVAVTRGQELTLDAHLAPTGRRKAAPWVIGGAGVLAGIAAATGIVAELHDSRASDQLALIHKGNAPPSAADKYDAEVQSRDHFVTATWVLGGTAVAVAAVGAALYFFDSPSTEGLHVAPVISNGSGGVALGGRF
jgi:hypothetical protein